MTLLFWLAVISLLLTVGCTLEIVLGMRRMTHIGDVPPIQQKNVPKVSVIIPACNEAATIGPALRSVLAMDYADLEVMVVNDRSTDETGAVLHGIQKEYPRLQTRQIFQLPKGWLGKNHALQNGAEHARGEYLLFTDADIIMEKTAVARAISHMLENRLDHVSMFFKNIAPGGLLNALFLDVGAGLMLLFKPWKAKDPNSRRYIGVGAFNLVKASAYSAIGGHRSIALHPIDDVMLGKVIKHHGLSQDCLLGHNFVQVKWYATVREFINGCMKNGFALYNYSVFKVLFGVLFVFTLNILPLWAFFFTSGITRGLFGAVIIIRILSYVHGFSNIGVNPWYSIWSVVTPYVNIYISIKAAVITTRNKGIVWRGTFYSLDELKTNRI
ncbi:MAG TPA: glycosyltransferase family 2 protein [Desulfobacterales bacterium]|nr:glycosyltransferase family 2 protein [Desulfobacterales bacterium]